MIGLQDDISEIELKQRWRLYWIATIFEFSHLDLQEKFWFSDSQLTRSKSELFSSSYADSYSAYFEILALDDAYEAALKSNNVSSEEAKNAQAFHNLLVFYDEPWETSELMIEDPEWRELVNTAQKFWNYLERTLTSQREIDLIKKMKKEFS